MGILENFENAWDIDFQEEPKAPEFESTPIPIIDNMGRLQNDGLALKMFKEDVCDNCGCKDDNSENLLSSEDLR